MVEMNTKQPNCYNGYMVNNNNIGIWWLEGRLTALSDPASGERVPAQLPFPQQQPYTVSFIFLYDIAALMGMGGGEV